MTIDKIKLSVEACKDAQVAARFEITNLKIKIAEQERIIQWATTSIFNLTPQTLSLSDIERKLGHKVIIRDGI